MSVIHYTGDLHLEFNPPLNIFEDIGGDILILAGDIIDGKLKGLNILEYIASKYNHVIMIMGNHEHYKGKFTLTYSKLKANLPSNIHLLQNEVIEIDGQRFLGCTLWSWMNEVDSYFAKVRMNDYRVVRTGPKHEPWLRKLSPMDTISDHMQSALWLEGSVREGDIVITHHAPSFKSCNTDYEGNTAYATDLSDIILDNKPKYWIHSHLHDRVCYKIGDTTILSNPYGYYEHETTEDLVLRKIIC